MKSESSNRQNQTLHRAGQCLYRSDSSGIYYGVFKRAGRRIERSLKTSDKELAKRRLERLRQKVARFNTKEGAILFEALANRWLDAAGGTMKPQSRRRRLTAIHSLTPHFRNTVRAIGSPDAERWASVRGREAAARTFNIERETLIQIFDYALREGLILDNPVLVVPRRKQPKPQIIIPTKAQFRALLEKMRAEPCAAEAADLVEFLAYSGCRLGEATAMTWGEVNFELHNFTVTGGAAGTKNHEARTVPLFPPLERLLSAMRDALPRPPQPTERIFSIGSAKKAIATGCRKAGLLNFTHHSFRHFFCSNAIEAGADFKVIAGWLGHKDGGVLVARTYGHLRDEHSHAMAKRMTFDATADESAPDNVAPMSAANR